LILAFGVTTLFYMRSHVSDPWEAWGLVAGSIFFCGLLNALLFVLTGRRIMIQRMVDELAAKNAELEQFAFVASHDLKEPLRMVVTYLQYLQRQISGKLTTEEKEFFSYAIQGGTRMHALVEDLLAFARVKRSERDLERVNLNHVLEEVQANLRSAIQESHAEISVEPLPDALVERLQMIQLFQNLIGNAIKYRGEEVPRIRVSVLKQGSRWVYSVEDNGIGIETQYREKIFKVFQRLHSNREKYPGTGIGLSICKKIVERYGGRIWVDSRVGQGSTFSFFLSQ
jgi:light-regulated signal transduction histidine kinase (bacteriophytochrome)